MLVQRLLALWVCLQLVCLYGSQTQVGAWWSLLIWTPKAMGGWEAISGCYIACDA